MADATAAHPEIPARTAGAPIGFDYDRRDAAKYLGVSLFTLEDWARKKINLPYLRLGNKAWYKRAHLDDHIRRATCEVMIA